MTEKVAKQFRGEDGKLYTFEVDAPPPAPPKPPEPTMMELIRNVPIGFPVPYIQYAAWSQEQRQNLEMFAQAINQHGSTLQQVQQIVMLLARAVEELKGRLDAETQ